MVKINLQSSIHDGLAVHNFIVADNPQGASPIYLYIWDTKLITIPADDLAPNGTWPSAGTGMTIVFLPSCSLAYVRFWDDFC